VFIAFAKLEEHKQCHILLIVVQFVVTVYCIGPIQFERL